MKNNTTNQTLTLSEYANHMGLTLEEVFEPNISRIHIEGDTHYKEMSDTGELVEID